MKGADMDASNAVSFGNITAINDAGNYEFNYICGITGNDVMLEFQILRAYDPAQMVQLVSVPVYSSVTIGATVTGSPWDPVAGTGGIVALEATNTVFLNADIDVSGQGFQGGAFINYLMPSPYDCDFTHNIANYFLSFPPSDKYSTGGKKGEGITDYITNKEYGRGKQTNGGGGGNSNNTGGAGGGNYGTGGNGGQRTNESAFQCHGTSPGIGGLSLSAYGYTAAQNRIFLGGGGGGGHQNNGAGEPGGNGGGIVIITAPVISGSGNSILANGVSPTNPSNVANPYDAEGDGGGGGGAGGTVILNAGLASGTIPVNVNGARGSDASNVVINDCTGPGGGGGAGVIWTSGGSLPAAIAPSTTGGNNGVIAAGKPACTGSSNSATAGSNGLTQTNYTAPMGTVPVCTLLPISVLKYFKGKLTEEGALLIWEMNEVNDISYYKIESSIDQVNFTKTGSINNNGVKNFSYNDQQKIEGTIYYRLVLVFQNGSIDYSAIVPLSRNTDLPVSFISLQPNPAIDHINLLLFAKKNDDLDIIVYNAYGQHISSMNQILNTGYTSLNIPLSSLASGTYFLFIKGKYLQVTKRFIIKP